MAGGSSMEGTIHLQGMGMAEPGISADAAVGANAVPVLCTCGEVELSISGLRDLAAGSAVVYCAPI